MKIPLTAWKEEPMECPWCAYSTNSGLTVISSHIAAIHLDYFPLGCAYCGHWFSSEAMLKFHCELKSHPCQPKEIRDPDKEERLLDVIRLLTDAPKQRSADEEPAFKRPRPSMENEACCKFEPDAPGRGDAGEPAQQTPSKRVSRPRKAKRGLAGSAFATPAASPAAKSTRSPILIRRSVKKEPPSAKKPPVDLHASPASSTKRYATRSSTKKQEPPKQEPPKQEPSKQEPPRQEPPKQEDDGYVSDGSSMVSSAGTTTTKSVQVKYHCSDCSRRYTFAGAVKHIWKRLAAEGVHVYECLVPDCSFKTYRTSLALYHHRVTHKRDESCHIRDNRAKTKPLFDKTLRAWFAFDEEQIRQLSAMQNN